jgi:hypothetical protein
MKIENDQGETMTFARTYKGFALIVRDAEGNEAQISLPALRWLGALNKMAEAVKQSFRNDRGSLGR